MKSKKAEEFLEKEPDNKGFLLNTAYFSKYEVIEAVELAEQEMLEKAVSIFKDMSCRFCAQPDGVFCDMCVYHKEFISQLNNK